MSDGSEDAVGEGSAADTPADREVGDPSTADGGQTSPTEPDIEEDGDLDALRQQVEEKYDFENFGPREMQEMSPEEWDAAFDPDTWITGEELLERVEADLKTRVANRDVFARVERFDDLLVAYSDSGYAAVYPDGSVEGRGTVLRDVKPVVALCSMDSYDAPEKPEGRVLPDPQAIPEQSSTLGNTVLQIVAGVHVLAGLALLLAWILYLTGILSQPGTNTQGLNLALILVAAVGFLAIGIFLFVMVANARLSDKFRSEEFRNRLRAIGLEDGERPEFLSEIEGLDGRLPPEFDGEADADGTTEAGPDGPAETNPDG